MLSELYTVTLSRGDAKGYTGIFGFWQDGPKITKIVVGGSAEHSGRIEVGDTILAINNKEVTTKDNIVRILGDSGPSVTLRCRRLGKIYILHIC